MAEVENGNRKYQILLLVASVVIIAVGLSWMYFSSPATENATYANVTILGADGSEVVLEYDELKGMESITGEVSFQNRLGNWGESCQFEGVMVADLVERVGGMGPGDVLRVTSPDGYYHDYSYYNIYPEGDWEELQGDLILAFSCAGEEIPDWEDGPRTVFLPDDGEFSNMDARYTSASGQGYFLNPSAGSRLVRDTWKLEVINQRPSEEEWTVSLEGKRTLNLTRTEFGTLAQGNRENVTDGSGNVWSGLPIEFILGLVDGQPYRGDDSFNTTWASSGYEAKFSGTGERSVDSRDLSSGDPVILADLAGGQSLPSPALVSDKAVAEGIDSMTVYPLWVLEVVGDTTEEMYLSDIMELEPVTGSAGFLKTTGAIRGPFEVVGAPLLSVLQEAISLPSEYSVDVVASDDYRMILSQEEVQGEIPVYDNDGNQITVGGVVGALVYELDGSSDFSGSPLRLVYIGDGGEITDGHYWIKEVKRLVVKEPVVEWSIELSGKADFVLNRSSFISAAECEDHRTSLNITRRGQTHEYSGLPLWVVLSLVDGKVDPEGHYLFDDDLASENHGVKVVASDDYSATLNSTFVARNDDVILAYMKDGELLGEDEWPLRLVGPELSGKQSVSNIVRIEYQVDEQMAE
jgi:hypothetical protein